MLLFHNNKNLARVCSPVYVKTFLKTVRNNVDLATQQGVTQFQHALNISLCYIHLSDIFTFCFRFFFIININVVCKRQNLDKNSFCQKKLQYEFFCPCLICSCIFAYFYGVYYFSNCCILLKIKTIVLIK